MKKFLFSLVLMLMAIAASAQTSIYDFTIKDTDGHDTTLAPYKGQVMLIVNTATQCGFTPQYAELEALYQQYKDRGFTIVDFPCNQFGGQAPGSMEEIHQFCTGTYDIHFPQLNKVDVNGPQASPLFAYLIQQKPFVGFGVGPMADRMDQMMRKREPDYDKRPDIKWNFTKFLIDREGRVIARFEPTQPMSDVKAAVEKLL